MDIRIQKSKSYSYLIYINKKHIIVNTNIEKLPSYIMADDKYRMINYDNETYKKEKADGIINVFFTDVISKDYTYYDDALKHNYNFEGINTCYEMPESKMYIFSYPNKSILYMMNDREVMVYTGDNDVAIFHLRMVLKRMLVDLKTDVVGIHASAVYMDKKAYAILGDGGSGKTTLAINLSSTGYKVISDDLIFFNEGTMEGCEICFSVRSSSKKFIVTDIDIEDVYYNSYHKCYYLKKEMNNQCAYPELTNYQFTFCFIDETLINDEYIVIDDYDEKRKMLDRYILTDLDAKREAIVFKMIEKCIFLKIGKFIDCEHWFSILDNMCSC